MFCSLSTTIRRSLPLLFFTIAMTLCFTIALIVIQNTSRGAAYSNFHSRNLEGSHRIQIIDESNKELKRQTPLPNQRKKVAKRKNMEECKPVFGKIMVFIAVEKKAYQSLYKVALDSIKCYLKSTPYELKIVDVFNDIRVNGSCTHESIYFRKHCAAATYLEDTDYMMVMDADTGIVNPNHCIEEYIDTRVDMVFYERFFNWEIMSGNYLAKNSEFSKDFMMRWANYEFFYYKTPGWWRGFDNGVLHIVFLESVFHKNSQEVKNCHKYWSRSTDYETYLSYVMCVRIYLGGTRIWPGRLKLMRRAHGFARDWYHTYDLWWEKDFMIHGWKANHPGDNGWASPFTKDFDLEKCDRGYAGWSWRIDKKSEVNAIRELLEASESSSANAVVSKTNMTIPFLSEPDIANCYPDCDEND